ncbi:putative G-protein coupled receptor 160 isoform 2-T3 [Aulostomus maculatus]
MFAIIEQWDMESGCHRDNLKQYVVLVLIKLGVDAFALLLLSRTLCTSLLSMCSLSVVLADMAMAFVTMAVWLQGAERSPLSICYVLAFASATFAAVPLPMVCLGLLDYYLEDTCNHLSKPLRNVILTLLVWAQAGVYAYSSVDGQLMVLNYMTGRKALLCEVQDSTLIAYFALGLFGVVICLMLPFWSMIPQWIKEADRLHEAREKFKNLGRNLKFPSTCCTETTNSEERDLKEAIQPRPPLWISLTLGFSVFWMPYLGVSVSCLFLGFQVPAYITVNLLWLECTNSLLAGVIFWIKSEKLGPYTHLPENMSRTKFQGRGAAQKEKETLTPAF